MSNPKKFKIISYVTGYSKKKGAHEKRITVEKDIPTLEGAKEISKQKYGNLHEQLEWKSGGLIFPTVYKIK